MCMPRGTNSQQKCDKQSNRYHQSITTMLVFEDLTDGVQVRCRHWHTGYVNFDTKSVLSQSQARRLYIQNVKYPNSVSSSKPSTASKLHHIASLRRHVESTYNNTA